MTICLPFADLNLDKLSHEAAELIMNYPNKPMEYFQCVRKLSKFICVEIKNHIESNDFDENIDDKNATDTSIEFNDDDDY